MTAQSLLETDKMKKKKKKEEERKTQGKEND